MRNQWSCKVVYKRATERKHFWGRLYCSLASVYTSAYRKWDGGAYGKLNGVISGLFLYPRVPSAQGVKALKLLLLCSLFASDGCVKSGGGVFGTVCLEAEAKGWGVVWWIGRQVCCPPLPTAGASHHALHALSQNSLWPWVWRQISHTLANSNKFFSSFFVSSPLSPFSYFYTST